MDWVAVLPFITGFGGVLIGAATTFWANRERLKHEKKLDRERYARRFQERSEEAARLLLDLCYRACERAEEHYRLRNSKETRSGAAEERVYRELDALLHQITAYKDDLCGDGLRSVVEQFHYSISQYDFDIGYYFDVYVPRLWWQALADTTAVLGAYRRGEQSLPDTSNLQEVSSRIKHHRENQNDLYREEFEGRQRELQREREARRNQ